MNIQQFTKNRKQTSQDQLKTRVLEIARALLDKYETDIESGIEDGIYEEDQNIDSRALIAEAKAKFYEFEKSQPAVYVCVEGGVVQGASATCEMDFTLYDVDNYKESEKDAETQTPDEWNAQIEELTKKDEIKPVY